jgi:hypothetical protein
LSSALSTPVIFRGFTTYIKFSCFRCPRASAGRHIPLRSPVLLQRFCILRICLACRGHFFHKNRRWDSGRGQRERAILLCSIFTNGLALTRRDRQRGVVFHPLTVFANWRIRRMRRRYLIRIPLAHHPCVSVLSLSCGLFSLTQAVVPLYIR